MLSNCSHEPVRKAHSGKATLPFAVCVYVCAGMHACVRVHVSMEINRMAVPQEPSASFIENLWFLKAPD